MKILGNISHGLVFVFSAPAGTGKTTIVRKLIDEFPCFVQSVSFTTRPKREDEVEGDHYHFVDKQTFFEMQQRGDFIESVSLFNHNYGTSRTALNELRSQGKHVALVIDTVGALQLMEIMDGCFIFLSPPSIEELLRRLKKRNTERDDMVRERLANVRKEMASMEYYDYIVVNDELEVAYQAVKSIIIAEEHKARHQANLVKKLIHFD